MNGLTLTEGLCERGKDELISCFDAVVVFGVDEAQRDNTGVGEADGAGRSEALSLPLSLGLGF